MIKSIRIQGAANFGDEPKKLEGLSLVNFIFGTNGTGKTTISRIIAKASDFPHCVVEWKDGVKLEPLVYNHDFVERNFHQVAELKGVFTLGEQQKETLDKIAKGKANVDKLAQKLTSLTANLSGENGNGGKIGELKLLENFFKEKTWKLKQEFAGKNIQNAFKGVMGSKENFKARVLNEQQSNKAEIFSLEELEKKSSSIFGENLEAESMIAALDAASLLTHESNPILQKRVIGKGDVDIAAMIKKLGNSDWVRTGRTFYDANDHMCPFCQQETSETFARSLNDYFDETFISDSRAIDALAANYTIDAGRIRQRIEGLTESPSRFLDAETLRSKKELLDTKLSLNIQKISEKKKEASQIVKLDCIADVVNAIKFLIDEANQKITEHNKLVANLESERKILTAQVWRFVLKELESEITDYMTKKKALDSAIFSMEQEIENAKKEKAQKQAEIQMLEKETTSVLPTIGAINNLLLSFGFQSFKLAPSQTDTSYKLIRPDGSDAKATLSEGEKTFLVFLYFYYLLEGSLSEIGITENRVIVFDDPVSSLDSEVLFIVSALIKKLFDSINNEAGNIKQIFIMTHNVYFHKEISYNSNQRGKTFWVVRKTDNCSVIDRHDSNPIKTSYDLLWGEVRRKDRSNIAIQNTLRRILENYFKILGGFDLHKLSEEFEGRERAVCGSLISWINDGSHFAHDDLYVSLDNSQVETYLRVFEEIFKKSGHHAHYRMMMRDAFIEELPEAGANDVR